MVALAGGFAGVLMALIFVGHMAIVLVFYPPAFIERHARSERAGRMPLMGAALGAASMVFWTGFGVGAAFLFSASEERFPTASALAPSAAYLAIVAALAFVTAPLPFVLLWRLRRHLLFQYAVFLAIFGLMVPWTARGG